MGSRDRDPFDDIFNELSRMMDEMMGGNFDMHVENGDSGFGTDVHLTTQTDDDHVYVIADLPGIDKEAIDVKCDGKTLTISASTEHREYEEQLRLPVSVDEHAASATFNNNILEIKFERNDSSANINVE
ncbi:Hsp20/alpha crystallin family protein [Halocatena halophila]|uniref:Hsp20/alpha crystallin family protein n=1 Tax=Halocatena halophila TaxID=2814576 RepID=UPI002ED47EC1